MQGKQPRQEPSNHYNVHPVLLSKTELGWLRGEFKVSKLFEYQLRSRIRKKVQTLVDVELPLLIQTQFIKNDNNIGLDGIWRRELLKPWLKPW